MPIQEAYSVWTDNPTEPESYRVYLFQDSFDDDTPEAVAFRDTIRNASLRCATCALNGKQGCRAFKCNDGETNRFAEALSFDGGIYRYAEGGDEYESTPDSEATAAWRGFLNATRNAKSRDEVQTALDAFAGFSDDQIAVQWANIEAQLFCDSAFPVANSPWEAELRKLVFEAEKLEQYAEARSTEAKDARKRAAAIRENISTIIAQGSANFQPSEALIEWGEQNGT